MTRNLQNAVLILSCTAVTLLGQGGFVPGCAIPFKEIQTPALEIDKQCAVEGGSDDPAKRAESAAKNNFCSTGTPVPINFATFKKLEAASTAEIRTQVKTDRKVVKDMGKGLGEGTVVQFVAFLLNAHVSNPSKGELVNCNIGGAAFNDIHIELVTSADEEDACKSVTAEMSPHMRPKVWTELPHKKIDRHPVRVTGHLFFDGSHQPCRGNTRVSPPRMSVWEIHPVYQFEVCKNKSLSSCKVGDNSVWIPLHLWHGEADYEKEGNN